MTIDPWVWKVAIILFIAFGVLAALFYATVHMDDDERQDKLRQTFDRDITIVRNQDQRQDR